MLKLWETIAGKKVLRAENGALLEYLFPTSSSIPPNLALEMFFFFVSRSRAFHSVFTVFASASWCTRVNQLTTILVNSFQLITRGYPIATLWLRPNHLALVNIFSPDVTSHDVFILKKKTMLRVLKTTFGSRMIIHPYQVYMVE